MSKPVENVSDYPRPPRLEPVSDPVRIVFGGKTIAQSNRALRILETFHAPTYYVPLADFIDGALVPVPGSSFCEWKGTASYFDIVVGEKRAPRAAWSYSAPTRAFLAIAGHAAVYAEPMDACFVGDEKVTPQPGNFYGGWVNSWITGPIKGAPGTTHW